MPLLEQTPFVLCLVSVLIPMMFTERVSIFGIHGVPISIIQKRYQEIKRYQEWCIHNAQLIY